MASKTPKIFFSTSCPICGRGPSIPARTFDVRGKVLSGCVDEFHTGHLTLGESSFWHHRPEARKIRATMKAGRDGFVTQFSLTQSGFAS
jgi:hypothetical protein